MDLPREAVEAGAFEGGREREADGAHTLDVTAEALVERAPLVRPAPDAPLFFNTWVVAGKKIVAFVYPAVGGGGSFMCSPEVLHEDAVVAVKCGEPIIARCEGITSPRGPWEFAVSIPRDEAMADAMRALRGNRLPLFAARRHDCVEAIHSPVGDRAEDEAVVAGREEVVFAGENAAYAARLIQVVPRDVIEEVRLAVEGKSGAIEEFLRLLRTNTLDECAVPTNALVDTVRLFNVGNFRRLSCGWCSGNKRLE